MDSTRILPNAILPLLVESEIDRSASRKFSPMLVINDPRHLDKANAHGEMSESQNNDGMASDFAEGGNLQVRLLVII